MQECMTLISKSSLVLFTDAGSSQYEFPVQTEGACCTVEMVNATAKRCHFHSLCPKSFKVEHGSSTLLINGINLYYRYL